MLLTLPSTLSLSILPYPQALRNLIVECIDVPMASSVAPSASSSRGAATPLASIVAAVTSALAARYQVWRGVAVWGRLAGQSRWPWWLDTR